MPKSQVRKKKVYTPPSDVLPTANTTSHRPSPTWVPATAVGLALFGVIWLVIYYLSGTTLPAESWGYWNLAIGFGAMVGALAVFTRWK